MKKNSAANKRKRNDDKYLYEFSQPKNKFKPYNAELEKRGSRVLFGGTEELLRSLEEAQHDDLSVSANDELGTIPEVDAEMVVDENNDSVSTKRKCLWHDEDDEVQVGAVLDIQGRKLPKGGINSRSNKYSDLLRHKFSKTAGTPSWASLDKRPKQADSDSEDELLQTCGYVRNNVETNLPHSTLEYKMLKDLNGETYSEGPYINSVEFHPLSTVALVAGNGQTASLYAVDGKRNNKLHSIKFDKFPIMCSKFINNGNEIIFGSRHKHIYSFDLMTTKVLRIPLPHGITQCKQFIVSPDEKYLVAAGKWGEVHIFDALSKEKLTTLKQDAEVTALSYNSTGTLLFGHSSNGEITTWDLTMRRVKHIFMDDGCLQGTTLAVSSSNQFIATGSAQGVVNLYGFDDVFLSKSPKPRKTIFNLTTSIKDLKFNHSSEMLALTSSEIPNAIKLFHLSSGTVFSNFPSFSNKFGNVTTVNFSPRSGYFAFGNKQSTVFLYRLKHYTNY